MNIYRSALTRQERRQRRDRSVGERILQGVLGLAVLAAGVPVVRAVFLSFLDGPPEAWSPGLQAIWLRAALLVMLAVGLTVHGSVLRGDDRPVLSLLPVDPVPVVHAELLRAAWARLDVLVAMGVWLAPIGLAAGWTTWALGMVVVLGAWCGALTLSAVVFLGAIEVAESPVWAPWLDLIRGVNPRAQAAVIWALAPSTLLGGALSVWASAAATSLRSGMSAQGVWLALPFLVAVAAAAVVPRLATRAWFVASVVLGEIRARYDAVEQPEEAHRVYVDWVVTWLPARIGRWTLLDLRHGWRAHRSFVSATWLMALAALAAGWTTEPRGAVLAGVLGGAGAWMAGMVPVVGAGEEPGFLRVWLPRDRIDRALARGAAVAAWSLAPVFTACAAVLVRQGTPGFVTTLLWSVGLMITAVVGAATCARWREAGRVPYVAVGLLCLGGAAFIGVTGGVA